MDLWSRITEIPNFGCHRAKEKSVAAQPVVLKAFAKITYDLNFNNRRPENAVELYEKFLAGLPEIDFSHSNSMWNFTGSPRKNGKRLGSHRWRVFA